ncbi:orotate phosphoribosyltransferase [Paenibacillus cremeus]|uniref:Orotate phosphoribosyltransferase n=1 Tax=Paenibacillus cremeus TaxID=2163881 RepID=A0A559KI48_9BACL|nr:orotate phosphoribosyltransferase [Paenibacillus cremeus]TVY11796.1 orotate phosphoribosyltransferase [Paenibacillus cremeus]
METKRLAQAIYEAAHLTGTFRLRSGQVSEHYFDKYRFESDPTLLAEIAGKLALLIPEHTEVLAGLELGGVPIATALSLATGLPVVFVRKQAKGYGTCKLAEGVGIEGKRVCIIEDVVTTGGQIAMSAKELRERGAQVESVRCVIERDSASRRMLEAEGLELASLFTLDELMAAGGGQN